MPKPRRRRQVRVKTRYKNSPIADTSPAISRGQSELADVPRSGGNDPSLAVAQQLDALNHAEQSQRDRSLFQQEMIALNPEPYRESAAPPPPTPRQQPRDFFQPPAPRSERSTAHLVSAPVSR